MKKLARFLSVGFLLLVTIIVMSSCDKGVEAPAAAIDPSFTVTATTVQLQGGVDGLQFFATSGNVDVKMARVIITDPVYSQKFTFSLNKLISLKIKGLSCKTPINLI